MSWLLKILNRKSLGMFIRLWYWSSAWSRLGSNHPGVRSTQPALSQIISDERGNCDRGVETMSENSKANTGRMASCLVTGFILMVIIEQLVAPSAHLHTNDVTLPLHKTNSSHVEPVEHIEDLSQTESSRQGDFASVDGTNNIHRTPGSEKAFSLLLGLVIHAAADGLALGVANLARNKDGNPNPVSFIVFLALMLHKGDSLLSPS